MKKILVILIFLIVAIFICNIAPNYYEDESYLQDELRVVFNDKEITHEKSKLPQEAKIVDGKVMLSKDTVDILFDKWLYYDSKYNTIISTTDIGVAKLELDKNSMDIDGVEISIDVPAQMIDDVIYIPIEELQDFYNIDVKFKEKVVITTRDADYVSGTLQKKLKIKLYKKTLSKTIATCSVGEDIAVFNYKNNPEWVLVRRSNGDLGFARMNDIKCDDMAGSTLPQVTMPTLKVNLIWEYAQNTTPDRSGEKKIDVINVVAPTWISFSDTNGNLRNTIDESYIKWAHDQGYSVWATFKNERVYTDNGYRIDSMKLEETSAIVTDMKTREKIISDLINLCKKYNIDGINVDFEYMKKEDSDEFSQFIRELSAALEKNGLFSSVDVTVPDGSDVWSLCYNRYQLADAADYLVVMTYDQYSASSSKPGSVAELSWVENNIKKLVERDGIDPNKIVLGIPLYSRLWWNKGNKWMSSSLSMSVAKQYLNKEHEWDEDAGQYFVSYESKGTPYMLWIEEEESVKSKLTLVEKYDLAGAAYWRRGYETDDFWEKIK